LPDASRDLPGRRGGNAVCRADPLAKTSRPAAPMRSCSRWGLPCRRRHRRRGALLPHHFTLACHPLARKAGGMFLWHFP